jgi:putative (di)nucleoside polyphosphate hydrolase
MLEEMYREAAAILVLRPLDYTMPDEGGVELLLLHKPRKRDAWQLPQGGMEEGESVEQAAVRELAEEAGLTDVSVIGASETIYLYDFPASFRRFRPDHIKGQRIRFVFALVSREAQVTVDEDEIDDSLWILPSALPAYIKRKEYRTIVERLIAEATALIRHES